MKNTMFGKLSLAISTQTQEKFDEIKAKFSDFNIEGISVQIALPEGNVHIKVEDFFIDWEEEEDSDEE